MSEHDDRPDTDRMVNFMSRSLTLGTFQSALYHDDYDAQWHTQMDLTLSLKPPKEAVCEESTLSFISREWRRVNCPWGINTRFLNSLPVGHPVEVSAENIENLSETYGVLVVQQSFFKNWRQCPWFMDRFQPGVGGIPIRYGGLGMIGNLVVLNKFDLQDSSERGWLLRKADDLRGKWLVRARRGTEPGVWNFRLTFVGTRLPTKEETHPLSIQMIR